MNFAQNQSIKIFLSSFIVIIIAMVVIYNINYNNVLKEHSELAENVAKEIAIGMEQHLLEKVKTTKTITITPIVLESLKESNEHYTLLSEQIRDKEIQSKNEKWKGINDIKNPFILKYTNNAVSQYLKNLQANLEGEYGEIFITNKYGALMASTGKLTTFAHVNKYWWKGAYNDGNGAVFFDDRGYDESVDGYVLGIVVPIKSEDEIIGILKVNLNILGSLGDIILNFRREDAEITKLVRSGGLIIFEEGKEPLSERVSAKLIDKIKSSENSFILDENGEEWIIGKCEVGITSGFNNYQFGGDFVSIDHKKGNTGESWYIADYHPIAHIKEPVKEYLKRLLILGFLISLVLAFISRIIGNSAAKPIQKLIEHAKRITKGDFDTEVSFKRNDEIGFLGKTVNQMAKSLKETTTSVDKLNTEVNERFKAEEALRSSEKKLIDLFNNLHAGIIVHAPDTSIKYSNLRASELLGLFDEQMIGIQVFDPTWKFIDENNNPLAMEDYPLNKTIASEESLKNMIFGVIRPKDSKVVWLLVNGFKVLNNQGELIEAVISFIDITDRKQIEKQIKEESEEQIILFDKREKQRIANLVVLNDLNKTTKDLKAEIIERKRSEQIQKVVYNISNAVSSTDNLSDLILFIQKELSVIIDTKNFYVALYNEKTDALELPFYADEENDFSSVSATNTLTKYVIETKKSLLADVALKDKLVKEGKLEYQGSLSKIWLGVPLKIDGKVSGAFAVQSYTDEFAYNELDVNILEFISDQIGVTIERKRHEVKLKEALEKATESDRLKSAFLTNMSHEIRTPLNAVLGFSELLSRTKVSDKDKVSFAEFIRLNGESLAKIIDDIIDISKLQSKQLKINKSDFNLHTLFSELNNYYHQLLIQKGKSNIKLELDLPTSLDSDYYINTDEQRLKQILNNLISNAIKYSDKGTITFGYKLVENTLHFFVKDMGFGISRKNIEQIFERFVQFSPEYISLQEGTGLGLSICKNLVALLGGEIKVESELQKGSNFYFQIPLLKANKPEKEVLDLQINMDRDLSQYKILIADDEDSNYVLTKRVLKHTHVKTDWATNGKHALEMATEIDYDLILMDVKMPEMDGIEATRLIKKHKPNTPIIMQTAFAMTEVKDEAIEAGCDGFIVKPISIETFLTLVNKHIK